MYMYTDHGIYILITVITISMTVMTMMRVIMMMMTMTMRVIVVIVMMMRVRVMMAMMVRMRVMIPCESIHLKLSCGKRFLPLVKLEAHLGIIIIILI